MPRNDKKRPPAEPIEARISASVFDQGKRTTMTPSCGSCGQKFPFIFHAYMADHVINRRADGFAIDPSGVGLVKYANVADEWLLVMNTVSWGWKFDGTTWRPTAEHRSHWRWACEVVRRPELYTGQDFNLARRGLDRGSFPRNDKGRALASEVRSKDVAERFVLPTMIECIKCSVINRVDKKS